MSGRKSVLTGAIDAIHTMQEKKGSSLKAIQDFMEVYPLVGVPFNLQSRTLLKVLDSAVQHSILGYEDGRYKICSRLMRQLRKVPDTMASVVDKCKSRRRRRSCGKKRKRSGCRKRRRRSCGKKRRRSRRRCSRPRRKRSCGRKHKRKRSCGRKHKRKRSCGRKHKRKSSCPRRRKRCRITDPEDAPIKRHKRKANTEPKRKPKRRDPVPRRRRPRKEDNNCEGNSQPFNDQQQTNYSVVKSAKVKSRRAPIAPEDLPNVPCEDMEYEVQPVVSHHSNHSKLSQAECEDRQQ